MMRTARVPGPLRLATLLAAAALIGCESRSVVGGRLDVPGSSDIAPPPRDVHDDAPDGPAPADKPAVAADVIDASPDVATDVPVDTGPADVPPARCTSDADCAGNPGGPACDTASGRCVPCTPTNDTCPAGQYCAAATSMCEVGCRDDASCTGIADRDGGTSAARRCDARTRTCVDCVTDAHCAAGTLCVGTVCVAGCNAGRPCPAGQTCCSGACVDGQANVAHCGRCDNRCAVANGSSLCMNGTCTIGTCTAPFEDCNRASADGCETDTRASLTHCGSCGNACVTRPNTAAECAAGRCVYTCATGFADCDGDAMNGCEADTRTSLAHCGACGRACALPNATAACVMGACNVGTCNEGFGDCDATASNGCETDTRTTVSHCGRCGAQCPTRPNALSGCLGSRCVLACLSGFQDCDGEEANGCEVDTRTDVRNCGSCGRTCTVMGGSGVCRAGSCSVLNCDAALGDCDSNAANGCETNTSASVMHCGGCGRACAARANATASCATGTCRYACDAGFADCDGNEANGCETDTRTALAHCGACDRACAPANGTGACVGGTCGVAACNAGFADCDRSAGNGCETNTTTSAAHCGRCGNACLAGASCAAGTCTAPVLAGCAALHAAVPALPSGVYTIDPDGAGGRAPFAVYCDMTSDGGGWTYGAIVRTTTSSDNRSRVAGVTTFGTPVAGRLDNEYSVNLTGVRFREVRIDNFTLNRVVRRTAAATLTWDMATMMSDGALPAKRLVLGEGSDFRVGYYLPGYCGLNQTNIPMCFTSSSNPVGWVCDTDSGPVEGWVDGTGGEICGMFYCRVLWRDTACTSYVSMNAVYGFAVR